ncbi:hypothetical protein FSH11_024285 [Escherichia coli]|uniref:hypothetical protein n=1 Tax=Escherichia coli TaxID=562 RepID=UPI00157373DD|nr:hypothetical protein [Escherichia coli]EFL6478064.1 hypothetical protein [Escherichia coli]MBB6960352.1 hypothetical protein [Escherichia coli]MBC0702192.1 hypothetical protein [Escherichia coli]
MYMVRDGHLNLATTKLLRITKFMLKNDIIINQLVKFIMVLVLKTYSGALIVGADLAARTLPLHGKALTDVVIQILLA